MFYVLLLDFVFSGFLQAQHCSRHGCLGYMILLDALLLTQLLLRTLQGSLRTDPVDILRPFCRLHQHDHTVKRNIDKPHTNYNLGPVVILFFLLPYLAFLRGNDHILMMGHDGLLAVQSRYDNDAAFSVEKYFITGNDLQADGVHTHTAFPYCAMSFLAFPTASSKVPT